MKEISEGRTTNRETINAYRNYVRRTSWRPRTINRYVGDMNVTSEFKETCADMSWTQTVQDRIEMANFCGEEHVRVP